MSDTFPYDSTFGAVLLGGAMTLILYGVTLVQCFIFYTSSRHESRKLQLLVAVVLLMDTVHVVAAVHLLYWLLVTNYGNVESLAAIPWSLTTVVMLSPTSDTIIRLFYTHRIWILSKKNKWHVYPLLLLIIALEADALANAIETTTTSNLATVVVKIEWVLYLGFSLSVLGDFWIAGVLSYFLHKSRAGIVRTNNVINTLMLYTINTGLLTALVQLSTFMCNVALPKSSLVWLGLYLPLGKLYANALLASLNARDHLKSRLDHSDIHLTRTAPRGNTINGPTSTIRFQNNNTDSEATGTTDVLGSKIETYPTFKQGDTGISTYDVGSESNIVFDTSKIHGSCVTEA
ncbi:hypothetical protein C8R47DRAFT_1296383 [Mycena vitilis]|nr:hypothetical protein C8R47DRAFT_1296383 [Mycena vitilis]